MTETETKKNNYMNNSDENFKNLHIGDKNDLYYEKEIEENDGSNNSSNNSNNEEDKNKFVNEDKNSENIKANSLLNIFLLDIDGNINYYTENGIKTIFNVNKVKDIDKILRDRGLFSLNYSYFIKFYKPYLAISTDNGCYIFQLKHI